MRKLYKARFLSLLLITALLVTTLPLAACAAGDSPAAGPQESGRDTQFTFTDSGIEVAEGDYADYKIDGTTLSITGPGRYSLSGKCADGAVTVKKGVTGVWLTLAGLELTSASTAPLVCAKSSHVTISVQDGTENTLTDATINNDDVYPENEDAENAVLKCKDGSQVTICGTGTLNIVSNGKNGIKSGMTTEAEGEAWMTIRDLTLNVTVAVNDGINAEQTLDILSGNITVNAADDGIHCDRALNIGAAGADGPVINIEKSYEGLEGADLAIYSGTVTIHAEDDGINAANSDLGNYPFTLTIAGGKVYIDTATGDGIDSNGTLTISGGEVEVYGTSNGDNAPLDSDGAFTITGGTVLAVGAGNMAQEPNGENQAFVSFGGRGGFMGGHGGFLGGERPDGTTKEDFRTRPGQVGLLPDPNAPKPMSTGGGQTPPERPDDFQRGERWPGMELPQDMGGQDSASFTIAAGSELAIRDQAGNTLATGKALRSANYVFFSSPAVTDGGSYTLYVDGEKVADGTATTQGATYGGMGRDEAKNTFQDVAQTDWFYDAVRYVRAQGLMNGVSGTSFAPQSTTTRGMIWTILARLSGVDTTGGDTWYAVGQSWAKENGVSDGSAPDRAISREELMTMLYRYAQKFGTVEEGVDYALDYPDAGSVHGWAVAAAKWWTAKGVVNGKGGLLVPQGNASRAEVAVMLQRYCQI